MFLLFLKSEQHNREGSCKKPKMNNFGLMYYFAGKNQKCCQNGIR